VTGAFDALSGINAAMMLLLVGTSSSSKTSSISDPFELWEVVDFALVGGVGIILRALVPIFRIEADSAQDGLDGKGDGGARTAKSELEASERSVDARLCTRPPCICSNFLPTDFPTVSTQEENAGSGKGLRLMLPVAKVLRPGIEEGGGRVALAMVAVRL